MSLGYAPDGGLDGTIRAIEELWRTVGFTNVNDQPTKLASRPELERIAQLLESARQQVAVLLV